MKLLIRRSKRHYILCDDTDVKAGEFVMYLTTVSILSVAEDEVKYYNSKENKEDFKRIIGYGGDTLATEEYIKIIPMDKIRELIKKVKPDAYIDVKFPIWHVSETLFNNLTT